MQSALWHAISRFAPLAIILGSVSWIVYRYGNFIGLNDSRSRFMFILVFCVIAIMLRYGEFLFYSIKKIVRKEDDENIPSNNGRSQSNTKYQNSISDLKRMLRKQYGLFWHRKTTMLMIIGNIDAVEKLVPGLSEQYWLYAEGTVLLWGGTTSRTVDSNWLASVRDISSQSIDAIVWATSDFDKFDRINLEFDNRTVFIEPPEQTAHRIGLYYEQLKWRIPLFVWSVHDDINQTDQSLQSVGCLLSTEEKPESVANQLQSLMERLTTTGTYQVCNNQQSTFLLDLANLINKAPTIFSQLLSSFLNPSHPLPVAGFIFSQSSMSATNDLRHYWVKDARWNILLESLPGLSSHLRAKKIGFSKNQLLVPVVTFAVVFYAFWMAFAYISNRNLIHSAQQQVTQASAPQQPLYDRLRALLTLQQTLSRLQFREEHGAPWYSRAGLSQNAALLEALWPRYRDSAQPLLRDAAADHLQQRLDAFIQLPPDSPLREQRAKKAYDHLKLYLMLTHPERMDPAWFSTTLLRDWPRREGIKEAAWQGIAPPLLTYYGTQLATHRGSQLSADSSRINQARALLVRLMGMRNSESSLYQKMLSQVAHLYADMRLEDMTGDRDAARLFTTAEVVPGMFTRQAWEQGVQPAIDKVVETRRDELDWVLTDGKQPAQQDIAPDALKQRLTDRYFADFSGAWLSFLNSLRWQRAATLSDAIDQLTLMADVRQSPLVSLMNTLNIQGRTGQSGEAISDSLVKSAKNLLGGENRQAIDQSAGKHGPLDDTFGPLLALMDKTRSGTQAQSLQAFLTRVTQVRLRLQQVTNAADPQAMTQALAQTVFQGKAVDLTETRDYGSLLAAGLGQEWSSFGRTVFIQPMEQAWQQVLSPAAESLNAQWQQAVVSDWNGAFSGRYPFNTSSSDVSLPLLAKYLNADTGRITQFLQTRLQGVLHKEGSHWVPDSINAQGLTFNPAFLQAMNTLSHISDVAFTQGNAGMSFELRPGTAAGVMQTDMVIDSQKLTYVNQMPTWKRFTWPADTEGPGAALSWISTKAGTRLYADMSGAWGWIRLLDKAAVSANPGVGSSYNLSWRAPDGLTLNYTLRTEAGEGPLALLKLRNFRLPEAIFTISTAPVQAVAAEEEEEY